MARSGHRVFLRAPNVEMIAPQPPLQSGRLIDQLMELGLDLLPGIEFRCEIPFEEVDIVIAFGDSPIGISARHSISLNSSQWAGFITPMSSAKSWMRSDNPFGALAAGGLAASEAFKVAMHKLMHLAPDQGNSKARFALSENARFQVAPEETSLTGQLGQIDWISGGAVTQAALYCLTRIPDASFDGRVFEPDTAELSNLNRYPLFRRSQCGDHKGDLISASLPKAFPMTAIPKRFDEIVASTVKLAPTVIVGVDHIPSRWLVQVQCPSWLLIGATSHWCVMTSYHERELGCARCLHNIDEQNDGPLPTCAVVSFWAGLLVAAYAARHAAELFLDHSQQQIYMTPFRAERPTIAPVPRRQNCPICGSLRKEAEHVTLPQLNTGPALHVFYESPANSFPTVTQAQSELRPCSSEKQNLLSR
jgi:hypothetical protein